MTDKELRKLSRSELLELLLEETRRNERLCAELKRLNEQLASRAITVSNAGSLAEAALQLNGVFEAAQAAADQYLANTQARCQAMEEETRAKCVAMLRQSREDPAGWKPDVDIPQS